MDNNHNNLMNKQLPVLLTTTLVAALPALAQYTEDFQSYTPPASGPYTSFSFAETGTASITSSGTIADSGPAGVGDTAYFFDADFSLASGAYWGAGMANASALLNSGSDISQITFSFDLYTSETSNVQVILRNGAFGQPALEGYYSTTLVDTWQTFSFTLDTMTPINGTYDPTATTALVFQINAPWGQDASNIVGIDNISISAIPEPSTYAAIFGLAVLTGVVFLRRRR